jgi:hypothetical protein
MGGKHFPDLDQQLLMQQLNYLRGYLSQDQNTTNDKGVESYGEDNLNADLEVLYMMLISPFADYLADMNPEDKLIFVAPEVCNSIHNNSLGLGVWLSLTCFNSRHAKFQEFNVV